MQVPDSCSRFGVQSGPGSWSSSGPISPGRRGLRRGWAERTERRPRGKTDRRPARAAERRDARDDGRVLRRCRRNGRRDPATFRRGRRRRDTAPNGNVERHDHAVERFPRRRDAARQRDAADGRLRSTPRRSLRACVRPHRATTENRSRLRRRTSRCAAASGMASTRRAARPSSRGRIE